MTPEERDDADEDGAGALRDEDDDDAGSDGAHLSLTVAANPGLAASRSRAAWIPARCASRRPFGADPLPAFPLDEGFGESFEDRCCRPCEIGGRMDGRVIFLLGGAWGAGPDAGDDVDAASMRRTSLAPNVAGVFAGVLSPSPVKVTINDDEGSAAAVPSICAFSCASLLRLFRRRSLAAFLALFLAFSILLCFLPEGESTDETETGTEADGKTASSPPEARATGAAPVKASDGAVVGSFFPLLLFRPPAASGAFFEEEGSPVSDAVAGTERAPIAFELEAESGTSFGAA